MSITSGGTRKAGPFSGNGGTTSFPFTFKVFQASDLLVVLTDATKVDTTLTLTTHYTVSLNANQDSNPGGSVNMVTAPPTDYQLTIGSQVPQIQSVTLTNNGGFYPTVINTALDYLTILIQQVSEKVGRALTLPFSAAPTVSAQLPPVSAGSLLGWKQDGSGIANVGATGVGAGGIVASNMAAGATGAALYTDMQAAKATPSDADKLPLFDSASFWSLKSLTWANLKATLFSGSMNQNFSGQTRSLTPLGGALVREWADSIAATTGNIEIGVSYNCAVNPVTGVWAGRDVADICWLEKWSDVGGQKEFWYAPSAAAGVVPAWQKSCGLDSTTGIMSFAPIDAFANFTAAVAANALFGTLTAPLKLSFRNTTLGAGAPVSAAIGSNLTLTVPSGATLGTTNGVAARLVWLVAYNGGTPVLCVVNLAGGLQLDETNMISPTTISTGATSAGVIYSAGAVGANSPYRVVGFTDITEATAGTWATAPSTVQPVGGQALAALSSFGYGQTWQDVTSTRVAGTTYYNTTGKPIQAVIFAIINGNITTTAVFQVNGTTFGWAAGSGAAANSCETLSFVIPSGAAYVFLSAGGVSLTKWSELR